MCKDQPRLDAGYAFTRLGFQVFDPQGRDVMKMAEKECFSVSRVAEELGLSLHQFKALFEKTVGLGPKEFFRHFRAVKARRMISESVPLAEISEQLGFRYYTHFASEIRFFYGIPPRDLQRIVQPTILVARQFARRSSGMMPVGGQRPTLKPTVAPTTGDVSCRSPQLA